MHGHYGVDVDNGCGLTLGSCGRGNSGGGLSYLPTYIHLNIPLKQVFNIKHTRARIPSDEPKDKYLTTYYYIVEVGLEGCE